MALLLPVFSEDKNVLTIQVSMLSSPLKVTLIMNYLAHLHIAEHTNTSFSGNFLGDFVKGDPTTTQFPDELVLGIRLHRAVDSFTDQNPISKDAKQYFPIALRRFAPIALDMFWDHCLACNWSDFHSLSLSRFCAYAQHKISLETQGVEDYLPEHFQRVNHWVWEDRWLESYQKIDNISYALSRMSARNQRMLPLADTAQVLVSHQVQLNELFLQLYPQVLQASRMFIEQQKKGD